MQCPPSSGHDPRLTLKVSTYLCVCQLEFVPFAKYVPGGIGSPKYPVPASSYWKLETLIVLSIIFRPQNTNTDGYEIKTTKNNFQFLNRQFLLYFFAV